MPKVPQEVFAFFYIFISMEQYAYFYVLYSQLFANEFVLFLDWAHISFKKVKYWLCLLHYSFRKTKLKDNYSLDKIRFSEVNDFAIYFLLNNKFIII